MSNSPTAEQARQQGQQDANTGKGAADTNGWNSQAKQEYDAAYNQNKK